LILGDKRKHGKKSLTKTKNRDSEILSFGEKKGKKSVSLLFQSSKIRLSSLFIDRSFCHLFQ